MCRLTQNNSAIGKNHSQFKVRPWCGEYFSLNKTNKKNDKMTKLKISGRTSVRWIKTKMDNRKETKIGQNLAHFLITENKNRKALKIKKTFIQIRPANPNQL